MLMDERSRLIGELDALGEGGHVRVQGVDLSLSHLDKPIADGVTKRDIIRYAIQVSPWLLPHVQDRPITMTRYPNGISSTHFFQKNWVAPLPPLVDRAVIASAGSAERVLHAIVIQNLVTLVWLANLANIECHAWYSRLPDDPKARKDVQSLQGIEKSSLNQPDFMVFDVDPSISIEEHARYKTTFHASAYRRACVVAQFLREECLHLNLRPFVKTSGKTGVHIYVPIKNGPTYDIVRVVATTIAQRIVSRYPHLCTIAWSIKERGQKVFIDVNQNARGRTLAAPYSLRPTTDLRVSMPLPWSDLPNKIPTAFTWKTVPDILQKKGDVWSGILKEARALPRIDS